MSEIEKLESWLRHLKPESVFSLSTNERLSPADKQFAYQIANQIRRGQNLSLPQKRRLKALFDKFNAIETSAHQTEAQLISAAKSDTSDVRHVAVRLAWHDSGWNGNICKDPAANTYCVGEHSLLSERIRSRRRLDLECRADCAGKAPNSKLFGEYIPPCFWSINLFSPNKLDIRHDNPAAPSFPAIEEELPPNSIFSWPFKLAFVKSSDEERQYGKYYPKSIFESRIEKYQKHLREYESLVFFYCKFSNPVSGEDQQYLLVGCAFLLEKGEHKRFEPTTEQLSIKRRERKMQNFPTLNWALRYSVDTKDSGVRLPYQEYLSEVERPGGSYAAS